MFYSPQKGVLFTSKWMFFSPQKRAIFAPKWNALFVLAKNAEQFNTRLTLLSFEEKITIFEYFAGSTISKFEKKR
jgi:hypothetical protein